MDTGKRKRPANGNGSEKPKRRQINGDETVNDDDVEEFFAILRRMHDATRCVAVSNGVKRPSGTAEGSNWRPVFAWEDFKEGDHAVSCVDGRKGVGVSGENKAENGIPRCLDLNADPEPEAVGVGGPVSPA